jgi:hypothetical protein
MDTEELMGLAERLLVVSAALLEDAHPNLIATHESEGIGHRASNLAVLADRLAILAQCASLLIDLVDEAEAA